MFNIPNNVPAPEDGLKKCFHRAMTLRKLLPHEVKFNNDNMLHRCVSAVYVKQLKLYVAAYELCGKGLGREAIVIERAMYEVWLLLRALTKSKNPEQFAEDWFAWGYLNDYERTKDILTRHPEKEGDPVILRFLGILEDKMRNTKTRLESDYRETQSVCEKCGHKKIMRASKWDRFKWKGPALDGPTKLGKRVGAAVSAYYNEISGVSHSYDIHMYAIRDGAPRAHIDPTKSVLEGIVLWLVNSVEDVMEYLPLATEDVWKQIDGERKSLLAEMEG